MSYKYLTGRLIETQRSMIGEPAIRVARSIDGLDVTDDGTVKAIEGDGYEVVAELSDRYTDILGNAAADRLVAAANEFADDLLLPPALGGPEDPVAAARDERTDQPRPAGAASDAASVGVASDGGTVAMQSGADGAQGAPAADAERLTSPARPGTQSADQGQDVCVPEPRTFEYTLASAIPEDDYAATSLTSVYLMPAGDSEWQAPVTVEAAVVDAVSEATDLAAADVPTPSESIDRERLFATLNDDYGETVSFGVAGVTVTFHRSGSLAVH